MSVFRIEKDEWAEKVLRSYGGTGETIVVIPEGVKKIGANAFNNDHTIEKVVFPESIESIEKHAFVNCDHLKSVEFKGKSRLKLEDLAFDHCTDMREFNLTDNMESYGFDHTISGNIFRGCSKLKVIWEDRKRIIDTAGLMFLCEAFQKTALPSQFKKAEVKREVMAVAAKCIVNHDCDEEYEKEWTKYIRTQGKKDKETILKNPDLKTVCFGNENVIDNTLSKSTNRGIDFKKLSQTEKVSLLEDAVLSQDINNVKELLNSCGSFEFTARALGLASLYGGKEIVDFLIGGGASFRYDCSPSMKKKYGCAFGKYEAEYSPMIACTGQDVIIPSLAASSLSWRFARLPEKHPEAISAEERALIAERLYKTRKKTGFKESWALYYAVLWACKPVTDKLMDLEVRLNKEQTDALTGKTNSILRSELVSTMMKLKEDDCIFAIEKFSELLRKNDKKFQISQKAYDEYCVFYKANVIKILFENTDTSKVNKTKLLEKLVEVNDVSALQVVFDLGVVKTPDLRDKLIDLAKKENQTEVLAWLLDYKARTADLQKEEERKEKKLENELFSSPNNVQNLKRIWSFKKLKDETLELTSYKGSDTEVQVPAVIGKNKVSSIGEECFSPYKQRINNYTERKEITNIVIPEGVEKIGDRAFSGCESLEKISIPEGVTTIRERSFSGCGKLAEVSLPIGLKTIGRYAFYGCSSMKDIDIPESVRTIRFHAFAECSSLRRIRLPQKIKELDEYIFSGCESLKEIEAPEDVDISKLN